MKRETCQTITKTKASFIALAILWALIVAVIPAAPLVYSIPYARVIDEKTLRAHAEEGWPRSQGYLGDFCEGGRPPCSPKNYTEAEKWYRAAANQGNANAMRGLAHLYLHGYAVEKDYAQAYFWMQLAQNRLYTNGKRDLEGLAEAKGNLTPEQIASTEIRIKEWKEIESPTLTKTLFKRRVIYLELKIGVILVPIITFSMVWTIMRPAKVNKYAKLFAYICMTLVSIVICCLLWIMAMQFYDF